MRTKCKLFISILIVLIFSMNLSLNSQTHHLKLLSTTNDKWCEHYYKEYKIDRFVDPVTNKPLTLEKIKNLGMAVAKWESNFDHKHILWEPTVNGNAYGTYSLLSPTARSMGWEGKNPKELLNPETNAKYALKYLFIKLEKYEANILHTLAAYNGGSLRMDNEGVIRNMNYVENVYPMYVDLNLYNRQK